MTGQGPFSETRWYAIQTRARHEKKVAAELRQRDCHVFLPLFRETHQWSDRKMSVDLPLFPCYLFLHAALSPRVFYAVARNPGVLGFVAAGTEVLPIPDSEIRAVQRLVNQGLPLAPHPFLETGQMVRIRGGALDNVEGVLLQNDARKLVVSVPMINRSVLVHLEEFSYEIEGIPGRIARHSYLVSRRKFAPAV